MAPRQAQLSGFERAEHPDLVEVAEEYLAICEERKRLTKREALKAAELLSVMHAHGVRRHRFADADGIELEAFIDEAEPKAKVRRTGEAESQIDDGDGDVAAALDAITDATVLGEVPPGLIERAHAAQNRITEEVGAIIAAPSHANGHKPKRARRRRS